MTHAPQAKRVPTIRSHHGDNFVDNYEWLRDKQDPEVIAHLEAENAYTEVITENQAGLRDAIFNEIKSRTQETDLSVPTRRKQWWYFARTTEGSQYPAYCRVPALGNDWTPPSVEPGVALEGEEVLLDCNLEAEGQPFFALGGFAVTQDATLLAYCVDNAGDERFTLRFKNLTTGELLEDVIAGVFYGLNWAPGGERIYYSVVDETWRPHEIRVHTLGTEATADQVVLREDDPGMWLGAELSGDNQELLISAANSEYGETWSLDLNGGEPKLLVPRELRLLHALDPVEVAGERRYFITHNHEAENNMVSVATAAQLGENVDPKQWQIVVPHKDDVKIEGTSTTKTHLCVSLRRSTTPAVQLLAFDDLTKTVKPAFDEELYTLSLSDFEFESPMVRLSYTSFVTPARIYDYELATGKLFLRKETPVLGGYQGDDYLATREWASAADGTQIPISIIRRKDVALDGTAPCLVYGYGSYEISLDPSFAIPRLSLLDRGVVFAIAHVRGGGELGRKWYTEGKKNKKRNSFTDFVNVTQAMQQWVDPNRIGAMGGSAGGLLMGAVLNLAPELYQVVVAQVPFVDALTSILDPDLPLSALEWEEWGNPITDPDAYAYLKSYTPYENVRDASYPKIAAVTSLNDTRVLYVEPAKWVQVLREHTTSDAPVVLKTEMDGGHGGASGRYEVWKDRAWDYAFILDGLGI